MGAALFLVTILFAGVSCEESDESNDEALLALLAYQMGQNASIIDICSAMTTNSAEGATCTGGVATAGSSTYHMYATNANHPLLSLELTFQLNDGGSLDIIGGMNSTGSSSTIDWGHGLSLTTSSTEGAHFKGTDGTTVQEGHIESWNPGTAETTICFEIHQKENPPHMLVNWTNGGCSGLSSDSQADAKSDTAHAHSYFEKKEGLYTDSLWMENDFRSLLENNQDVSDSSYNIWGFRITNGTVKNVKRFSTPSFSHG